MAEPKNYPDFDKLPPVDGMPQGCAWGIFDKDGQKDRFGTLNFITPAVMASAATEVKDGHSISLNWPLNGNKIPVPGRDAPVHNAFNLEESTGVKGWDETLSFNTQISSQWDSLSHFQHQASGLAYNGAQCTVEAFHKGTTAETDVPTLDHWHERGGLVGRGVLVDYKRYVEEHRGQSYHPLDEHRITVGDLEEVAKYQGVEFKPGDVLIVRTGYTEVMENLGPEDMAKLMNRTLAGVDGTVATAKWIWNKRFAAVASDSVAFETYPPLKEDGSKGAAKDLVLHSWLLAMFGMSIGEIWDLKKLSDHCKKTGRYSFMLTSIPLNHPGLVGSPPNALAIF